MVIKSLELNVIEENELKNEAESSKRLITRETLSSIFTKVPSFWNTQDDDLQGLIEYIMYRIDHIDEIIDMIINFIKERGGM